MNASRENKLPLPFALRSYILIGALYAVAVVLILRLGYLQIDQGPYYADKAERNRLREIPLKAQRGAIYGRTPDVVFAGNRAGYDIFLVPKECEGQEQEVCKRLEYLIGISAEKLVADIATYRKKPYTQIPVKRDVTRTELKRIEELSVFLPGVFAVARPQRRYLYGETAGQVMGWLNELNKDELKERPEYRLGDVMGRSGLEAQYEPMLRGKDGLMVVTLFNQGVPQLRTDPFGTPLTVWDQLGRVVPVEYNVPAISGRSIRISLDVGLQQKAEELLNRIPVVQEKDHATGEIRYEPPRGAIVVLNADTGEVYALASVPGYDPNVFVDKEGLQLGQDGLSARARLLTDRRLRPMRHRAFQEQYPPGSAFKVLVAIAALEEGVITPNTTFVCPGHFYLGKARWGCWKPSGHGAVNVVQALTVSCDVFFYNVGRNLGIDKIKSWASKLGLGELTGIDLPGEIPGLVPSPEWKATAPQFAKLDQWNRRWQLGETINVAIGQGHCVVTPLQLAVLTAAVVNGGRRVTPFLNLDRPGSISEPLLHEKTIEIVREGMRQCVVKQDYPSGTGRLADIQGMYVIGKTGTAQVISESYSEKDEHLIPYAKRAHAWFVAGVLDREPRIAVCVLYEHGLHGSTGAAPIARDLIEFFYQQRAQEIMMVARSESVP